jgi:hypothetical protein
MKTVIIRGKSPLPEALRDVVERGSTSVHECHVPGPTPMPRDVDRFVFFATGDDPDVAAAARQAARAERSEGAEKLVYVLADANAPAIEGLAPTEVYVWPRDEDRLKMAFMTGA